MMIDLLIYLIITITSIFIGLFLGRNFTRLKFEKKQATLEERNTILSDSFHEITEDLKKSQLEKEALIATKTRLGTELKNSELKLVENLANKILDEKSSKFTEQNKLNITSILNPLKEKIEVFEKKVSESQKESIGMHSALKEQLNSLKDLNIQMSKEAINLTKALKGDSKTQGDWGETQLEILLEKANLAKDIHFTTQGGYRDEETLI